MKFRLRRTYRHYAPPSRSPLPTGCLFAILVIAVSYLLFAYTDLRAMAVQALPAGAPQDAAAARLPGGEAVMPIDSEDPPALKPTISRPASAVPTKTSSPTVTATAVLTPTVSTALRPSPSVAVSNLVFLSGDGLFVWERRTNTVRPLAEGVSDYKLAADSRTVVLLRQQSMTANGQEMFTVDRLDLESGETTALVAEWPNPHRLQLTAAGDRAAFVTLTDQTLVTILTLEPGQAPNTAGICESAQEKTCDALAWSPDGNTLAWSDGRGLWTLDTSDPAVLPRPVLAHKNLVQVIDPEGQTSSYAAYFHNLRWSEDGRFILLEIAPKASPARWQGVLDVRSGYLASLQDTFVVQDETVLTEWLSNDEVMVAHPSDALRGQPPFIHLWKVFETNPAIVVSGDQYDLYSDEFPFSSQASKDIPVHHLDWLARTAHGKILVGVKLPATESQPVIFSLDPLTGKLTRVQSLPLDVTQVLWAPDGSGALITSAGDDFYFITLTGGELIELESIFQPGATQLNWLAPALPKKSVP